MGLHSGAKAIHHLENNTFSQLISLARDRAAENGRQGCPAMAIDMNWILDRFSHMASRRNSIDSVPVTLTTMLDKGIRAYAVLDPV